MSHTEVLLHSRRRERAVLVQKLQHAAPSIVLLFDGLHGVQADPHGFALALASAEIISSVLVIGSVIRALRHAAGAHAPAHHGVDWIDLFLSGMLATEALAHWHETGHLRRPTLLLAITMLGLGLLHGRITARIMRRRALRLTEDGITIGRKFRSRFSASWNEIARIEIDATRATIVKTDGAERRIDLADLHNGHAVVLALRHAQQRLVERARDV